MCLGRRFVSRNTAVWFLDQKNPCNASYKRVMRRFTEAELGAFSDRRAAVVSIVFSMCTHAVGILRGNANGDV